MNSSPENMANNTNPKLHEELRRYYNNELSPTEKNLLERRALEDPFLKDAMDGFDENPESFKQFHNKYAKQLASKRNYTLLIGALVLVALFGITSLLKTDKPELNQSILTNNTTQADSINNLNNAEQQEYEMLSVEVETLKYIPENEFISVQEVVDYQNNTEIPEQANPEQDVHDPIHVDDPIDITDDYELQDENAHILGQESVETIYLYDLRVVDYKQMHRENEKITYKRYEFGGTPANVEGEAETDLIEQEVQVPYHIYLTKSMSFFSKSNFKQALNRYLLILEQYPEDMNALFYGGLAYYNLGKYQKSVVFFDQILASEFRLFKEEAQWYKAKSLLKQKKNQEAILILEEIIAGGGFYTNDAIELRAQLQ